MSVEAQGDAFHVSIQVDETRYHCLRGSGGAAGVVDLGPFAFEGTEICRDRDVVKAAVQAFWADGEWLPVGEWNEYACTDAVSPLNATRDRASAEVGAMFQAHQSGQRGGDAKLRVRGDWCASPATRSDIKLLGRWLQLEKLTVVDADGSTRTFSGREFLPVAAGGKPWRT